MVGGSELLIARLAMTDNVVPGRLMACMVLFTDVDSPAQGRSVADILGNDAFPQELFTSFFDGTGYPCNDEPHKLVIQALYEGRLEQLDEQLFRCRQFLRASTALTSLPLGTNIRVSCRTLAGNMN